MLCATHHGENFWPWFTGGRLLVANATTAVAKNAATAIASTLRIMYFLLVIHVAGLWIRPAVAA